MTRHNTQDHMGVVLLGVGVQVNDPDNLQAGLNQVKDT